MPAPTQFPFGEVPGLPRSPWLDTPKGDEQVGADTEAGQVVGPEDVAPRVGGTAIGGTSE